MKKFAATGRADLLLFSRTLGDAMAGLLGYGRASAPLPEAEGRAAEASQADASPPADDSPNKERPIIFPEEPPRLQFFAPIEKTFLTPKRRRRRSTGHPISDEQLAVDWSQASPVLQPLARWSRVAPYLRSRLGLLFPGSRIDVRKLLHLASSGVPLTTIPRLFRRSWAPEAVIFCDGTPEMFPFFQDIQWFLQRLRRERGGQGLKVRGLRRPPCRSDLVGIRPTVPVLALSAMGQLQQTETTMKAWLVLGRRLTRMGVSFHALNPCPRNLWMPELTALWPTSVWDRHPRLPRRGGQRARRSTPKESKLAEELLDLLAPSCRIEAPLLRSARLKLGRHANAGDEWQAWNHCDCWQSLECFGFHPGHAYEARLDRLRLGDGFGAGIREETDRLIAQHHRTCSSVIAAEAELRSHLANPRAGAVDDRLIDLLRAVVDRLRLSAQSPAGEEGRRSGLPAWFAGMVDRLTEGMRSDPRVKEFVAEGLALSHAWKQTSTMLLPRGVDGATFKAASIEAARDLREATTFCVELGGQGNLATWQLVPASHPPSPGRISLGSLRIGKLAVHLAYSGAASSDHALQLSSPMDSLPLPALAQAVPTEIESDQEKIRFEPLQRPYWAARMYYDRQGLAATVDLNGERHELRWASPGDSSDRSRAESGGSLVRWKWSAQRGPAWATRFGVDDLGVYAEFQVKDVAFVMRWIPPGRFLMGSPEGEQGRYEQEGPQHEVTLAQGYWMGETPVTQAQWEAVMKKNPSQFRGKDLPVEKVSWTESMEYCSRLNRAVEGLGATLPTEAQWEHACRAGTPSAFHDGSECTVPEGKDPALEMLGWYDKNSEGKTQVVRQKASNAWGLYDMHGNVWEWCRDAWDESAYKVRASGVTNPETTSEDGGAARVVRGGSWGDSARGCRSAIRDWDLPGLRGDNLGLRLAAGQELRAAEPTGASQEPVPERRSRG